jgi:hypothetical protein
VRLELLGRSERRSSHLLDLTPREAASQTLTIPPCTFNPTIRPVTLSGSDCNHNGVDDAIGASHDFNHDGVPDECQCGSADFNHDGDLGTDSDIAAFFACLGGSCCATCGSVDFNGDGDLGNDTDIEAFFRVIGGGSC